MNYIWIFLILDFNVHIQMFFLTVQLLTEEYSTMSPGELEAKGFMPYADQPDHGGFQGHT